MTYDEREKQSLDEFIAKERAQEWPDFVPEYARESNIQDAIAEFKDLLALFRALHDADAALQKIKGEPSPENAPPSSDEAGDSIATS